ncbi:MAG TPA: hypothetical protein VI461_02030 [Chitinophagaceae bacterium]|nr:hypothetical protein [Chitinophagaceae bacterium]
MFICKTGAQQASVEERFNRMQFGKSLMRPTGAKILPTDKFDCVIKQSG